MVYMNFMYMLNVVSLGNPNFILIIIFILYMDIVWKYNSMDILWI
jgi:hypothetical protein